jgi:hypothetical protein
MIHDTADDFAAAGNGLIVAVDAVSAVVEICAVADPG